MWPARDVTKVLRLVIGESSENSPERAASLGEARRHAELYNPSLMSFWQRRSYLSR